MKHNWLFHISQELLLTSQFYDFNKDNQLPVGGFKFW